MFTENQRIEAINNSEDNGEYRKVFYKGESHTLPVKKIPLKYLLYNPYNGRIRSRTKSYESTRHRLNPENETDKNTIEQMLYDSAENRNDKTLESLTEKGQSESGIVTKDGIIIDGNRRAMLLNILNRRSNTANYFLAIVLPDKLKENETEIVTLETNYQMGVDSKVDYNPIEKYIRCKELRDVYHVSIDKIAILMAESEKKISDWLNILTLMDEYLNYLGSPEIYTRLDKREGHFVDLTSYLKTYQRGNTLNIMGYEIQDLNDMKKIYFDYIRLGIPVMRARIIAKPSNSLFSNKNVWRTFNTDHKNVVRIYNEPAFNDEREMRKDQTNEEIIHLLDNAWKENIGNELNINLDYSEGILRDIQEKFGPVKILKRVVNSLGQISDDAIINSDRTEINRLIGIIEEKTNHFKTVL